MPNPRHIFVKRVYLDKTGFALDQVLSFANGFVTHICPFAKQKIDIELGAHTVFPAFVNAHAHLEFAPQPNPMPFLPWLNQMTMAKIDKQDWTTKNQTTLIRSGCDTIVNHVTNLFPLPNPVHVINFYEVMGLDFVRALDRFQTFLPAHACKTLHSPYSLNPRTWNWFSNKYLSIHIGESIEEAELFKKKDGPLFAFLAQKSVEVNLNSISETTPLQALLFSIPQIKGLLAIHGNTFTEMDIQILSDIEKKCLVFCPNSNTYFNHPRPRFDLLKANNIPVALGTDSLASNFGELNILSEAKRFLEIQQNISWSDFLPMITCNAMQALGYTNTHRLKVGCQTNLVAFKDVKILSPHDLAQHTQGEVVFTGDYFSHPPSK